MCARHGLCFPARSWLYKMSEVPPGIKPPNRGWLTNPERRERRNRQFTLTLEDIEELLQKIQSAEKYTLLDPDTDQMFRCRDQAMIALAWIFFKRGGEDLRLRLRDVSIKDARLSVSFNVEKKRKYFLVCSVCGYENRRRSRVDGMGNLVYCSKCRTDLRNAIRITKSEKYVATLRKTVRYSLVKYVTQWIRIASMANGEDRDAWLFPSFKFFGREFLWKADNPMTIQNFDHLLQRLDPSLSSCMFRYGRTEVLADARDKKGRHIYSMRDLQQIGNWESEAMPSRYAERKGLTESQIRFEEDSLN